MRIDPTRRPQPRRSVAQTFAGILISILLASCARPDGAASDSATGSSATASADTVVLRFTTIGQVAVAELDESSGLATGTTAPNIFWTMNDDTDPTLYALSARGDELGRLRITGAKNVDWESLAIGPCDDASCIYIGDTGDNEAKRPDRTIYRVREPKKTGDRFPASASARSVIYKYSDGPKDVEAMYVSGDGSIWLISKRPLRDSTGRHRPALVYRLPPAAWSAPTGIAELVDSLTIIPGSSPSRLITDAALSPDGRTLAIRTYGELYLFDADSATGRPSAAAPRRVCDLTPVAERQGEGIAWESIDGTFLLTSEGSETPKTRSSLARVQCPVTP
jgi:hypothetical protein